MKPNGTRLDDTFKGKSLKASNKAIKQKLFLFATLSTKHKWTSICYRYQDETKWYKTTDIFKEKSQGSLKQSN